MKLRFASAIALMLVSLLLFHSLIVYVYCQGNAEVSRKRNLQYFEMMRAMDVDLLRTRNLQCLEMTKAISADVLRLRNLDYFELKRIMNADVVKLRNYQCLELMRTMDADVLRLRNLVYFEMVTPPHEYLINITKMLLTNQEGIPQTNFAKGDIVQIDFTIENIGSTRLDNGLISILILDPLNTTVLLTYTFETMSPSSTIEIIMGYRIPTEAISGTYTVKVAVFTDWPSEGGIGLEIEQTTFNVV